MADPERHEAMLLSTHAGLRQRGSSRTPGSTPGVRLDFLRRVQKSSHKVRGCPIQRCEADSDTCLAIGGSETNVPEVDGWL